MLIKAKKMIIRKSNPKKETFDFWNVCCHDIEDVIFPSGIKCICSQAFFVCHSFKTFWSSIGNSRKFWTENFGHRLEAFISKKDGWCGFMWSCYFTWEHIFSIFSKPTFIPFFFYKMRQSISNQKNKTFFTKQIINLFLILR